MNNGTHETKWVDSSGESHRVKMKYKYNESGKLSIFNVCKESGSRLLVMWWSWSEFEAVDFESWIDEIKEVLKEGNDNE